MNYLKFKFCPNCSKEELLVSTNLIECKNCNFKYYPPTPQTSAVFYEREGKVLLVKRDHQPFKNYWSLPAGFAQYGEIPSDAALREFNEETGLVADLDKILGIFLADDHPDTYSILTVIGVKNVSGEISKGDDAADVKFFNKEDLPNIAFNAHKEIILKNL